LDLRSAKEQKKPPFFVLNKLSLDFPSIQSGNFIKRKNKKIKQINNFCRHFSFVEIRSRKFHFELFYLLCSR